MNKFNFLENELDVEEIKYLPNKEKSRYIQRYLESLILKNKNKGLTLSEILKISNISKPTIMKYLEILFSKRKIYKDKKANVTIYYPNGRVSHPSEDGEITFNDRKYKFSVVSNEDEKFIYLQEKAIDENDFEEIVGGVMFPLDKGAIMELQRHVKTIARDKFGRSIVNYSFSADVN